MEFDDTASVIWGVKKWQYHRRGVSETKNLSVALARSKKKNDSHAASSSKYQFLQHPQRKNTIFDKVENTERGNNGAITGQ